MTWVLGESDRPRSDSRKSLTWDWPVTGEPPVCSWKLGRELHGTGMGLAWVWRETERAGPALLTNVQILTW